jgi:putative transposase
LKNQELLKPAVKYSVSTGTLYSWKKKHEKQGEAGLKSLMTLKKESKLRKKTESYANY